MMSVHVLRVLKMRASIVAIAAPLFVLLGWAPIATAQFEPPAGYYATATGTGATLQNNLHAIISTNFWSPGSTSHLIRTYGNARDALQILDEDPNDITQIVLIYTGNSVLSTWDSGVTWNREHTWPRSRGISTSGADNSDLHMLRPSNPSINSSRSNLPFGIGGGFWDPLAHILVAGTNHRGEIARAMFYAATRYDGTDVNTTDLVLVNGFPTGNQMGDLAALLDWHYSDPIDDRELRRNHLIFSNSANPLWYQGNRNPFVDHPEYVWAIWGPTPNSSTLFVGAGPAADGSSTLNTTLRAIVGAAGVSQQVTINKQGATPTTYNILPGSGVTVDGTLTGLTFVPGTQQNTITLRAADTSTAGLSIVPVTVDNTDLTSAGTGQGVADANDTISVALDILTPSAASFDAVSIVSTTLVQSSVEEGSMAILIDVPIHNLGGGPAQATLDVESVTGLTGPYSVSGALPTGIAGAPGTLSIQFDPAALAQGTYPATATLGVSDENIPGASASSMTLNLSVVVTPPVVAPCPGDANGDLVVNFSDITTILGAWLSTPTPGGTGDTNGDGIVNFSDVTTTLGNWGTLCPV